MQTRARYPAKRDQVRVPLQIRNSRKERRLVLHNSLILLDPGTLGPVELERRFVAVILRVPIAAAVVPMAPIW